MLMIELLYILVINGVEISLVSIRILVGILLNVEVFFCSESLSVRKFLFHYLMKM